MSKSEETKKGDIIMSDALYNTLKTNTQIYIPALATLYFSLAQLWGLPKAEEIVGTLAAVDVFLGLLLGYSSKKFNERGGHTVGDLVVEQVEVDDDEGGKSLRKSVLLELDTTNLEDKDEVTFKVKNKMPK